ncbi:MAG: hypothetical protein AAGF12_25360 [Myxococcota bacterium]
MRGPSTDHLAPACYTGPGATIRPENIGTLVLKVKSPRHYSCGPQFKDEYEIPFHMPPLLLEDL